MLGEVVVTSTSTSTPAKWLLIHRLWRLSLGRLLALLLLEALVGLRGGALGWRTHVAVVLHTSAGSSGLVGLVDAAVGCRRRVARRGLVHWLLLRRRRRGLPHGPAVVP